MSSLLKVFWPPNISIGKQLSKADTGELLIVNSRLASLYCLLLSLCAIPSLCWNYSRCCRSFAWDGLSAYLLFISPLNPSLQPPPGSEASLGNSLNTSEEELHTAGIAPAPKGTRGSRQSISIQSALILTAITIIFAPITIASTQKLSTLCSGLFCFYTTEPLLIWIWRVSPPLFQFSCRGYLCCSVEMRGAQVCVCVCVFVCM